MRAAHGVIGAGLALLAGAAACGGDGSGPSTSDLAGTWQVAKCEYVSTEGKGTVDLIAGGGSGTLVLTNQGGFDLTVTPASGPQVVWHATYEVDGSDLMRVTPAGMSWYWAFDMNFSGNSLKLTGGDVGWDFDDDGVLDPAAWNLISTR